MLDFQTDNKLLLVFVAIQFIISKPQRTLYQV